MILAVSHTESNMKEIKTFDDALVRIEELERVLRTLSEALRDAPNPNISDYIDIVLGEKS